MNIRPEEISKEEWLKKLTEEFKKEERDKSITPSIKLNINNIPEEYRKAYAIGVGVLAQQEMKNGLITKLIRKNNNIATVEKSSIQRTNLIEQPKNEMTDAQILNLINEDIFIINYLEEYFLVHYKNELIKMIISNNSLDSEQKIDLVQTVNNATVKNA